MKQLLNLDELPKVEKEIMEFLLDEYYSLEDRAETTSEDSFVIHYRDQTSYIINNIERIIKYNKPRYNAHFSQKKLEDLIEFLKKEYNYSTDTIHQKFTSESTYMQGVQNEARFFATSICIILGIDSDLIEEK